MESSENGALRKDVSTCVQIIHICRFKSITDLDLDLYLSRTRDAFCNTQTPSLSFDRCCFVFRPTPVAYLYQIILYKKVLSLSISKLTSPCLLWSSGSPVNSFYMPFVSLTCFGIRLSLVRFTFVQSRSFLPLNMVSATARGVIDVIIVNKMGSDFGPPCILPNA